MSVLSTIRVPRPGDRVHKDECALSFASPVSSQPLSCLTDCHDTSVTPLKTSHVLVFTMYSVLRYYCALNMYLPDAPSNPAASRARLIHCDCSLAELACRLVAARQLAVMWRVPVVLGGRKFHFSLKNITKPDLSQVRCDPIPFPTSTRQS